MYYIVGTNNSTLENFPQVICYACQNSKEAYSVAKKIPLEKNDDYTRKIFVIELQDGEVYKFADYLPSSKRNPVIFTFSQTPGTDAWTEEFYKDEFKIVKRKRLGTNNKKDEIANSGLFRAIVMFDSDEVWQIFVDVPTREEAYRLCVLAAKDTYPFCVFDDKGIAQTEKGQLIPLVNA